MYDYARNRENKIVQVATKKDVLAFVNYLAANKNLAWVEITGHGNHEGFGNEGAILPKPGQPVYITYNEMKTAVNYGLSWTILNACMGDYKIGEVIPKGGKIDSDIVVKDEGGRDLSSNSEGSRFGGTKKVLVPPFGTFHPQDLKPRN